MTLDEQSGSASKPELIDAMNLLWIRFLPEIQERVALLKEATLACSSRELSPQERDAAHSAAHKLAGTLGTFGLSRGTELAREVEQYFATKNSCTTEQAMRLTALAAEIGAMVESRQ